MVSGTRPTYGNRSLAARVSDISPEPRGLWGPALLSRGSVGRAAGHGKLRHRYAELMSAAQRMPESAPAAAAKRVAQGNRAGDRQEAWRHLGVDP
jgi:hypothetical protein